MIINHNMGSINAHRQMGINSTNASKSMEKLSSGLRINRAGDDAAGLSISEKMRGQIRGLDQASSNSQDAISMIQTAEGALNETTSILQRMRELAVQSATDTNTDDDRAKIQSEVDELAKEITRISNTTEFNTQNLLAGGLDNTFQVGANKGQNISLSIGAMDAQSLGVAGKEVNTTVTTTELENTGITSVETSSEGAVDGKFVAVKYDEAAVTVNPGGLTGMSNASSAYTGTEDLTFTLKVTEESSGSITKMEYSTDGGKSWKSATGGGATWTLEQGVKVDNIATVGMTVGATGTVTATAEKLTFVLDGAGDGSDTTGDEVVVHNNRGSVTIGSEDTDQSVTVNFNFGDVKAKLGGTTTGYATATSTKIQQETNESKTAVIGSNGKVITDADTKCGINVSTQGKANLAIETINNAITTVSEERSKLGAYQNRLEHTIANLGTSSENLTSAESRIRDVDMAKEMSTFSKNNILAQAAQSMLAQANQRPQQVLSLLQ